MARKCTYTWEIHNFMNLDTPTGFSLQSSEFWVDNECKWKLMVYPRGYDKNTIDYISVLIHLVSPITNLSVIYEFALLDVDYRATHKFQSKTWENMKGRRKKMGVLNFIHRTALKSQHLPRDSLKLFCNVWYIILKKPSNISPYGDAFTLTFQVGSKSFTANKKVLVAKNPTFYENLQIDNTGTIVILDVTADIFEEILSFIYTGVVKNLRVHAKCLIVAAEKYKVYALRDTCANYLVAELAVDKAIDMFRFAQDCHCQVLEDKVLNFIRETFVNEAPKYLVEQLINALKYSKRQ